MSMRTIGRELFWMHLRLASVLNEVVILRLNFAMEDVA